MNKTQACVSVASASRHQDIEQGRVSWEDSQRLVETAREKPMRERLEIAGLSGLYLGVWTR